MSGMSSMSSMPSMSSSSANSGSSGPMMMMNTFFVASTPNVPLWFSSWIPGSTGATVGACFGLFFLTVGVKLLGALRHQVHVAWSQTKWHDSGFPRQDTINKSENPAVAGNSSLRATKPPVPWSAQRDIPRGVLAGVHVALEYFLMLAVMTYNVYYFVAIVLGHVVGEIAFGRWTTVQGAHC